MPLAKNTIGVTFSYLDKNLHLRFNPNGISWTYELLTNVVDTYGGQVIQILGVKVGQLTIEGQFGREGPFGIKQGNHRYGNEGWGPKKPGEVWEYDGQDGPGIGLTEMTAFFRDYFQFSTQGGNINVPGSFEQQPMSLTYETNIAHMEDPADLANNPGDTGLWLIFPTEFPSYRRSNENFAPEWRVVAEVVQAPLGIIEGVESKAIQRMLDAIGFNPLSPWVAPGAEVDTATAITQDITIWHKMLPRFTVGDLSNLIYFEASAPTITFADGTTSGGGGGGGSTTGGGDSRIPQGQSIPGGRGGV